MGSRTAVIIVASLIGVWAALGLRAFLRWLFREIELRRQEREWRHELEAIWERECRFAQERKKNERRQKDDD